MPFTEIGGSSHEIEPLFFLLAHPVFGFSCGNGSSGGWGHQPCHGQALDVPAYSHIYSGDREKPFLLAVTLSIRNTDPAQNITVTRVDYYDTKGARIKAYIDGPILLKPMEATRYVVAENDTAGGSGASFMVAWASGKPVNQPIVESIMIGTQSQQGISFTSRGQVIRPAKQ